MTRCGDIADFSLRMRISVRFLLPADPISYLSLIVTLALSGLVSNRDKWSYDREMTDNRQMSSLFEVRRSINN